MTAAGATVLLVSHSQDDFAVERVAAGILRRGGRPVRLDIDRFPRQISLSTSLGASGARRRAQRLALAGRELGAPDHVSAPSATVPTARGAEVDLDGDEIAAVWLRRVWAPNLGADVAEAYRAASVRESLAALDGWLRGLPARRWINDPSAEARAQDKLRQLEVAMAAGLPIPETRVTNDAAEVRDLFARHGGNIVAKMLTPLTTSLQGGSPFVFTQAVSRDDLDALEGLRQSPMVFQERVLKARELRVVYVDGRCFPGALDASRYEEIAVDWRDPEVLAAGVRWERDILPRDVEARLASLMQRLGLRFGAIDLIRTPGGEHIFLEVNAGGEWGMLERDLGLPIADALAAALLAGTEMP